MAGEGLDEELATLRFEIEAQHHLQQPAQMAPPGAAPHHEAAWAAAAAAESAQQQQQLHPQHPPGRRGGGRHGGPLAPGSKNVVCIHYLVGMCALDKDCPYLHQYDLDRVPICP